MSKLLEVERVDVPWHVIDETVRHLRFAGSRGLEGITLWAGVQDGRRFAVRLNIVPEQVGHRTSYGVSVSVGADELHRINVWLMENDMRLIAQVHSHPGDAYHSETDDEFAIAVTSGSLSVVVPDFAFHPFVLADCAVYRLLPSEGWKHVESGLVERLIVIGDSSNDVSQSDPEISLSTDSRNRETSTQNYPPPPAHKKEQTKWHWLTSLTKRLWPPRTS